MTPEINRTAAVPRFLYDWLVPEVLPPLQQGLPVILYGGPGTGKSFLARRLFERLTGDIWINGKDYASNAGDVVSLLETALRPETGPVCIDDLDAVYIAEPTRKLLTDLLQKKRSVLVTTTLPPTLSTFRDVGVFPPTSGWDDPTVQSWSVLLQRPELHQVDPWKTGWQREIANGLRAIVSDSANSDHDVSAWWTIVVHLTGGHPVMLHEAFSQISGMLELEKSRGTFDDGSRSWRQEFARIEERLQGNALRRMRHAIRWLNDSFPKVGDKLKKFATGVLKEEDIDAVERRVLTDSALMHRGNAEGLVVSGAVLKQYLLAGTGAAEPFIEIVSAPDGNSGRIAVSIADVSIVLPVGETVWKIVEVLHEAKGMPVSIEELRKRAALDKVGAVRSALQRLRDDLRDRGVDGVIENVRGTGYRLGNLPILEQEQRKS